MAKKIEAARKSGLSFGPKTKAVKRAEKEIRLDAWRSIFEKTNRILSGQPVKISLVSENAVSHIFGQAPPGFSLGDSICFTREPLEKALAEDEPAQVALQMKGLNYHELSHVIYSPRAGSPFASQIKRLEGRYGAVARQAANVLEDQRIETWFSASYAPAKRYFEAMAVKHILADPDEKVAILLHGRKFLSPALRNKAAAVFTAKYGASVYDEMVAIIDEYIVTDPVTHDHHAAVLVERLIRLALNFGQAGLPDAHDDGSYVEDNQDGAKGRTKPASLKERKRAREAAKEAAEKQAEEDAAHKEAAEKAQEETKAGDGAAGDGNDSEEAQAGDGESGDGEAGDGDEAGDGEESSQGGPSSGEADTAGETGGGQDDQASESEDAAGSSGGGGSADSDTSTDVDERSLAEMAEDDLNSIVQDQEVMQEIADTLRSVSSVMRNGTGTGGGGESTPTYDFPVADNTRVVSRKIQRTFQKVFAVAEPEIMRAQPAGRLDTRRFLQASPNDREVFTSYDEGMEDETGMETVILLDYSGSMSGAPMQSASESVWALKQAFDRVGVRCTVIAYDTGWTMLYKASERAKNKVEIPVAIGGTEPMPAMREALKILRQSSMPNKVLVTVTDGGWYYADDFYEPMMKAFHSLGVSSMLLGLCGAVTTFGSHHHEIAMDIATAADIHKPVTALVESILKKAVTV